MTTLVGDGATIETAVRNLQDDAAYAVKSPKCHMTITTIRAQVKQGEMLPPIFLYEENALIHHIDGLHRMVAWCLESPQGTLEGYIGR